MKILLINNCHFLRGGADTVYLSTAELLKQAGHEVFFFSIADEKNISTGNRECFIFKGGKLRQIVNYYNNKGAAKALDSFLDEIKPDVAHVHLFWGGISPSIFKVLHHHRVPLVHSVHDYRMICPAYTFRNGRGEICEKCNNSHFIECFKNRCSKGKAVESLLMAGEMYYRNKKWHPALNLDGLIYVSQFAKKKHEEIDPRFKSIINTVLYNFSSVGKRFQPVEKDGGYYLYYGRLSHEKGIATLVNAFSKLPDLNLKVVGTGPKEEELKKMGCSNVSFMGYKTGAELYEIVRNAKFVCVPSEWYENNPMTIVEAYSLGVPVIGSNIGGIPEIIEDGSTGFIFESANEEDLLSVIKRSISISENDYLSIKKNAYKFSEQNFSSDNYLPRLISFYSDVISHYNKN